MAGITAQAFNGVLNSNEIYNALFNIRILFQKLAPQTVKRDEIVNLVEKAVGMYGKLIAQNCRSKIPEKNWKAEMPIRGEGYAKYSQPQRIGSEKI